MSSFNSKIKKKKAASDEIAMAHALNICHNIQVVEDPYLQHKPNYKRGVLEYLWSFQDFLYFHGYKWSGAPKGKKKKKKVHRDRYWL